MGKDKAKGPQRRSAPRLSGRVYYSTDRNEGEGFISDLSLTGARITTEDTAPKAGSQVVLHLWTGGEGKQIRVGAEVVRGEEDGFAVRFLTLDPRVQNLLISLVSSDPKLPQDD
jgi:hypothetical protein